MNESCYFLSLLHTTESQTHTYITLVRGSTQHIVYGVMRPGSNWPLVHSRMKARLLIIQGWTSRERVNYGIINVQCLSRGFASCHVRIDIDFLTPQGQS